MFAVVYIPAFSLQAVLRHEPELLTAPVALVSENGAKARLCEVTPAAQSYGLVPGMTSSQAKARCAEAAFRLRSAAQEEAAQEILLECAYFSAAYIESTAPGLCTIDLRGLPVLSAPSLPKALALWSTQLRERLASFNLAAQIGVAAAPALALQAARGAAPFRFVTHPSEFWCSLPLDALSPPPELAAVLEKWGIRTVSEFLALGRARLAERLGAAAVELFDSAQADTVRPLRLTAPRGRFQESSEFEQPVETLEPLLFTVRRLLEALAGRVQLAFLTIAEITLRLRLESGAEHENAIKIAAPTRDPEALFRICYNHLETVRTASAVSGVSLQVQSCAVVTEQFQLFETAVRDPARFYETIGRLRALLGNNRVGTPVLGNSHRPDDFALLQSSPLERRPGEEKPPAQASLKRGLPLRRFRPPLPAKVRLKAASPIFVDSSGPSGSVVQSQGPWRSSGNWWENLWAREEWDIQMKDGGLYRIFLDNNEWFVEGAYD